MERHSFAPGSWTHLLGSSPSASHVAFVWCYSCAGEMQNRASLTAWGREGEAAAGGEAILATKQDQNSQLPTRESRWLSELRHQTLQQMGWRGRGS